MIREYTLRLEAVRFRANIGASAAERSIPQDLVVDVILELPVSVLPKRDAKREVVDYDLVVRLVVEVGLAEPYRLLEVYVQRLLERLLAGDSGASGASRRHQAASAVDLQHRQSHRRAGRHARDLKRRLLPPIQVEEGELIENDIQIHFHLTRLALA